jgi:phage baseplate assembly protein gpV
MYQAFQGREWELPVIGEQVRRYSLSGGPPPQA